MGEKRFRSVHRKFTAAEKKRFAQARRDVELEKPALTRRALTRKAKMLASFNAMQLLKQERENRALSLNDVARRSGIDKSRLSKLENDPNENPTLQTLMRIAHAIGVKLTISVAAA